MSAPVQVVRSNVANTRRCLNREVQAVLDRVDMLRYALDGVQARADSEPREGQFYEAALDMIGDALLDVVDEVTIALNTIRADVNWQEAT